MQINRESEYGPAQKKQGEHSEERIKQKRGSQLLADGSRRSLFVQSARGASAQEQRKKEPAQSSLL